jgi:hypothetical protein
MQSLCHIAMRVEAYRAENDFTLAAAVRKGIPHNHVDLPLLVSVEATGFCIPLGNSEVLLAAVYKSPGRVWNDTDITVLRNMRSQNITH